MLSGLWKNHKAAPPNEQKEDYADQYLRKIEKNAARWPQPAPSTREAGIWMGGKGIGEIAHRQDDALHRLAVKYKPSKRYHNYIARYSFHFEPIRERVKRFVEIGVQTPGSLLMWEEYFPNAEIIGVDIDPNCKQFEGGRRRIFIGDQKDEAVLSSLVRETGGEFDIIIDDGEHSPHAILQSFCCLLPALSAHGIYAIEDLIQMPEVCRFLRRLERNINYWPEGYEGQDWPYLYRLGKKASWLDQNVTGVHFYRYLCIVNRGFNPEDNPYVHKEPHPRWIAGSDSEWVREQYPPKADQG